MLYLYGVALLQESAAMMAVADGRTGKDPLPVPTLLPQLPTAPGCHRINTYFLALFTVGCRKTLLLLANTWLLAHCHLPSKGLAQ